ncbi:hypothetical protein ACLB2K_019597 [Fragaria x ananassa]
MNNVNDLAIMSKVFGVQLLGATVFLLSTDSGRGDLKLMFPTVSSLFYHHIHNLGNGERSRFRPLWSSLAFKLEGSPRLCSDPNVVPTRFKHHRKLDRVLAVARILTAHLYSHGAFLWSLEKHLPDVVPMIFHHGEVTWTSVYKFHDWSMGGEDEKPGVMTVLDQQVRPWLFPVNHSTRMIGKLDPVGNYRFMSDFLRVSIEILYWPQALGPNEKEHERVGSPHLHACYLASLPREAISPCLHLSYLAYLLCGLPRLASMRATWPFTPGGQSRLASMRATWPFTSGGQSRLAPMRAILPRLASMRATWSFTSGGQSRLAPMRAISPRLTSMRASLSTRTGHLASHPSELFCKWTAYPADKKNHGRINSSGRVISPHSHVGYLASHPCELCCWTSHPADKITGQDSLALGLPIPWTKDPRVGGFGQEPLWVCSWTVPLTKRTGPVDSLRFPASYLASLPCEVSRLESSRAIPPRFLASYFALCFYSRGYDFRFLGPFLFAALTVLLGFSLIQIFHPLENTSHMIITLVGCIIFCGYIAYDADKLIKRHEYDEYMLAAVQLY